MLAMWQAAAAAAACEPQRINSRTAAGPRTSRKKVENILTVNVSQVQQPALHHARWGESDCTVTSRLCLAWREDVSEQR